MTRVNADNILNNSKHDSKDMMREFGPDTPKGMVYSINPALIIVLVPIITAATSTVPPLVMIQ